MSLPIVFRNVARFEYTEAAQRYEDQKSGLGIDFAERVNDILEEIAANPQRYPIVLGDTREAIVSRFPFCVYYRVKADRIVITAVFHMARDPSIWHQRK
jgi:toxin ParE1/3/4